MSFEKIQKGQCPNGCGDLIILKKPISKLLLIPEDLCDLGRLEGADTPMDMFGYITAICPECSFILGTPSTYEYDHEAFEWRRSSQEATQ